MVELYRNVDPREIPTYAAGEAAHYLHLPVATLRSWVFGRSYNTAGGPRRFEPVIALSDPTVRLLSFTNLVEAHVLAAIRRKHGVTLANIRAAIRHLQRRYGVDHPLVHVEFKTDGVNLFIENLGQLVNVSLQSQIAMREVMEARLERVEHDENGLASRLFPFTRLGVAPGRQPKTVVIDPRVAFGRPVLTGTGIPTAVLADRYKAGESIADLAADYEFKAEMVEEAIRCELAAA